MHQFLLNGALVFLCSLAISGLIVAMRGRLTKFQGLRNDVDAVQAAHVSAAPRLGGVAIVTSLLLAVVLYGDNGADGYSYAKLLFSIVPVFVVGFVEDLGYYASPRSRLLAAALSGLIFVVSFAEWLPRIDIPGFDFLLNWAPFAIAFSLFSAVGVSHSFNLVDGMNGLAALIATSVAVALALIAHDVGLFSHRNALIFLCIAISGFLLFNFPFGRIFLGDAGAYAIGHLLVWSAISIVWNATEVTPWAILLIFFWPVADTVLAIIRRLLNGKPVFHPDRMHFHQLVMRAIEITTLGKGRRRFANPVVTMFTLPLAISPMIAGVVFATERTKSFWAFVVFAILFVASYLYGVKGVHKLGRKSKT